MNLRDGQLKHTSPASRVEAGLVSDGGNSRHSVANAAPHFRSIDGFVWVERAGLLQEHVGRLRIGRISNTAVVDWAHSGALRFVEMADTLGAAVMGNHVDVIAHSLAVAHMVALGLRIAASFKNRLVRTFGQAGSTGDAFVGNQQ